MKNISCLLLFFLLFLSKVQSAQAKAEEEFITIVNPVRISSYTIDPAASLKSEYAVIKEKDLSATWLFTSDALRNRGVIAEAKKMDNNQEFGIFLEVSSEFAEKAGVKYHNTGFWHHATSVFLSGYTQEERKLMIDEVFKEFKEVFGYYPAAVGSWWTDSYSLAYMKEKYGITVNLTCSDQLSTDGYKIWGQPWVIPYYPNKFFTAVPASDGEVKLDIVNIQWAPRDPFNGYESSLYSTQDYSVAPKPQDTDYFKKLVDLYSSLGQITVGLEADLDPAVYRQEFTKQIEFVRQKSLGGVEVVKMSEFADWYMGKYSGLSPRINIESDDFLGTGTKAFWYVGPNYRLFYTKNDTGVAIKDLRIYNANFTEPYYESPNYSFNLSINAPFVISEAEFPESVWVLPKDIEIVPEEDKIVVRGGKIKVPKILSASDLVSLKRGNNFVEIGFSGRVPDQFGTKVKGYTSEAVHFFKQKKAIFYLLTGRGWNHFKKVDYLVPQGEVYALMFLKSLPFGKVMVYDHECLQCVYHSTLKPPAFANQRSYVKKVSEHAVVYNSSVFETETREKAKNGLEKSGAKYIYLVKFEDYVEKLPFSPGDLGIEKIFDNANAEVWRVK